MHSLCFLGSQAPIVRMAPHCSGDSSASRSSGTTTLAARLHSTTNPKKREEHDQNNEIIKQKFNGLAKNIQICLMYLLEKNTCFRGAVPWTQHPNDEFNKWKTHMTYANNWRKSCTSYYVNMYETLQILQRMGVTIPAHAGFLFTTRNPTSHSRLRGAAISCR